MPRVAYVDHSFHQKTASSAFLPEALRKRGHTVDFFWDYSWEGGTGVEPRQFASYDAVILFQLTGGRLRRFEKYHKNITFIPMYDSYGLAAGKPCGYRYWHNFAGTKLINFSRPLHNIATANGVLSRYWQFFPEPLPCPPARRDGLHGFFWCRRPAELSWEQVRLLIGDTRFDSFHLHCVPDPGQPEPPLPTEGEKTRHNITVSSGWFEDREEYAALLRRANVFFCPRPVEGIGMAMLEALANGQCVVAPDNGTMNEYIVHGLNGLLYDHNAPRPLDFTQVGKIGRAGQETITAGYARWKRAEEDIADYIFRPAKELYAAQGLSVSPMYTLCKDWGKHHPWGQRIKEFIKPVLRLLQRALP